MEPRGAETEPPRLLVHRLSEHARLPVRATACAAGYDLASAEEAVLVPRAGKALVRTDLCIAVPPGTYGRIAPRSGLAAKHFIGVGAGVVDADYRGNVMVLLFNHADEDFVVRRGDRVAQLVLERIETPPVLDCVEPPPPPPPPPQGQAEIIRGGAGFGSTGL